MQTTKTQKQFHLSKDELTDFYQVLHHNNLVEKCEIFKTIKVTCFSDHISAELLHFPYFLVAST